MTANMLNYEQYGTRRVAQEKLAAASGNFLRIITTKDVVTPMLIHVN